MKLLFVVGKGGTSKRTQAFTLAEMMVTMGIFSIVVLALVYTQLFGLKHDRLVGSKLGASDQSRIGFDMLSRDIRSAKKYQVGTFASTNFTPVANGTAQIGNAVQLCLSTNSNIYIVYYFITNQGQLRRMHSGVSGSKLIASNLTNTMAFRAELFDGTVQTDRSHKGLVCATLWFWQYQYPVTTVGFGNYYDSYRMELKFSPHVPDGP